MPAINPAALGMERTQFLLLACISLLLLLTAPDFWSYNPDSGIYIGTAINMLEQGRYWFNGHPNILYYPGVSALLTVPLTIWGLDFHILHLLFAAIAVATLWAIRSYFTTDQLGWTGWLMPFLVAASSLFMFHTQVIMSDVLFLGTTIGALLAWRRFRADGHPGYLAACALLVAYAPLVRFHGLFLLGGFGLGLLHVMYLERKSGWPRLASLAGAGVLVILPFALWTLRNYLLYTPDTYNMAGKFFFGQEGLAVMGSDWGKVDWIDAAWKYPIYQAISLFSGLGTSFVMEELRAFFPSQIKAALALGLLLLGLWPWLKASNLMESAYVLVSLAFLVDNALGGTKMYIPARHWVPMLPFFLLIAGMGLRTLFNWAPGSVMRKAVGISISTLIALVLVSGLKNGYSLLAGDFRSKSVAHYEATQKLSDYVVANTPKDAVLLTTDWGVAPMLTRRMSHQVARSYCAKGTLRLIERHKPGFLMATPGMMRSELALGLADDYPALFKPLFSAGDHTDSSFGAVYKIDLSQLDDAIARTSCDQT